MLDAFKRSELSRCVKTLIDRMGLRWWFAVARSWFSFGLRRQKWRAIHENLNACRKQYSEIAKGIPPGSPDRPVWVISAYSSVHAMKLEAILSLALRLDDFHPVVIEASRNLWIRRYHRLVKNRQFIDFWRWQARWPHESATAEFLTWQRDDTSIRGLLAMRFQDVDVGRIALSNFINKHPRQTLDFSTREYGGEMLDELCRVARNIRIAEGIFSEGPPALVLVMEKGFSPAAELVGVCLARSIPVIQFAGGVERSDLILKRYTSRNRHVSVSSLESKTWDQVREMQWGSAQESEIMRMIEEGYRAGTWFNRKFLHHNKQIKSKDEVIHQLKLDPAKPTAVVFSHVLWDATFFYGENLLDDYETWLRATTEAACANPEVNWVIKLHPDLAWKQLLRVGEVRREVQLVGSEAALPEHIRLVHPDTDISTYSFFEISDFCLTVRGTIGIEMACHGVPVLTAGTGRYSELGFTHDFSSRRDYLDCLASIQTLPPMSPEEIELARRFAFALFKLRPWNLRSFEMVQAPIDAQDNPAAHDLIANIGDSSEFRAASDLKAFVEWVHSDETDFMN